MANKVVNLFFSPTHSSKAIGNFLSEKISQSLNREQENIDCTSPESRENNIVLDPSDVLIFSFPVYSGRMPSLLTKALESLQGAGCMAIPVAVYGNRDFDDALLEASDILTAQSCKVVAGIAAIAQHTFDDSIASGRPDATDKEKLTVFAEQIVGKMEKEDSSCPKIPGNAPYKNPQPMPPLSPTTDSSCNHCGICAKSCPIGIIDHADERKVGKGCIICTACVKFCPQKAKSFPKEFMQAVQVKLEQIASRRKEPELFI